MAPGVTEQTASDDTRKHVGEMTVLKKLTIYISYQHKDGKFLCVLQVVCCL